MGEPQTVSVNGRKLPRFTGKTLFSKRAHNDVIDVLNPLLNIRVIPSTRNLVSYSEQNVFIEFDVTGITGSGGMNYKGEYSTGETYAVNDVVRVSPTNDVATTEIGVTGSLPGVYICVQDDPSSGNIPRNPIQTGGETDFWQWLATWPSLHTICNDGTEENWIVDAQKKDDVP